jgi:hypothetical protein
MQQILSAVPGVVAKPVQIAPAAPQHTEAETVAGD